MCWTAMVLLLCYSCSVFGSAIVLKLYGVPYLVSSTLILFSGFWLLILSIIIFIVFSVDIYHVAGLCYILASPWVWAETSLVPKQGISEMLKEREFCQGKLNKKTLTMISMNLFDRNGATCVEGWQQLIGIMDGSITSTMTLAHMLYIISFLKSHTIT